MARIEEGFVTARTARSAEEATKIVCFLAGAGYRARLRETGESVDRPWAAVVPAEELDSALRTCRIGGY